MFGLENQTADRALNEAWKDPEQPPWEVRQSPIEHRKIALLAPHLVGARSLLDCGCGGGDFLDMVMQTTGVRPEHVAGLDIAEGALERARRTGHYQALIKGFIDEAPKKLDRKFDMVLLSDVLSHVKEYVHALSEVAELVASGGKLFVSVGMGKKYFGERDVTAIRSILQTRGLSRVVEQELDYHALSVPRRRIPLHDVLWPQTHKLVLVYERPNKTS